MDETNGPFGSNTLGENGRAPGGKFAPGHALSRGPRYRKMGELRRAVLDAETPARVREVVDKMRELAVAGDAAAAKVYLDIVIGKPPQAVEVSGPDGEPLGLELRQIEGAILAALAPFGDGARFAVAAALRGMASDADGDPERPGEPA